MSFSRAKSDGWLTREKLTSTQMNAIDINQSQALDGYNGGVYSTSTLLNVGGSGLICPQITALNVAADGYRTETCRYSLADAATNVGTVVTLTQVINQTGFFLTANTIQVPIAGFYHISVSARVSNASVTADRLAGLNLRIGAVSVLDIFATRKVTADTIYISGSGVYHIATPASSVIDVLKSGAGFDSISLGGGNISIFRVA